MTHEQADAMLKAYRFEIGRSGHLKATLRQLESALSTEQNRRAESAALATSHTLEDMPHGTEISKPTERLGLSLAAGWASDIELDLTKQIATCQAELARSAVIVAFVSSWLRGLPARERFLVEHQLIDGEFWRTVQTGFHTAFGEDCSKDTLKRLKQRALQHIYEMSQ